jgi:2-polyprenyl-3-methyl-5-hydroxy-6-metoxy-1,4-benzoquinol methylase
VEDRFAGKADWFDAHYGSTRGRVRLALVLERIRERLGDPPLRILDAGGGTGAFAVPLALHGHDVTVLDASAEWLRRATANAREAGVALTTVQGPVERASSLVGSGFDAILCHAVLLYAPDPPGGLRELRRVARPGSLLSLLEKNRDALSIRPGFSGDYTEARRLLREATSAGRLGVENRAHRPEEWLAMLGAAGWRPLDWAGIRLFSDDAPEDLADGAFAELLALEREAGQRDPYRRVSRLIHLRAEAAPDP